MSEPLPLCIYCGKWIKPEDQWVTVDSTPQDVSDFGAVYVSRPAHAPFMI